MKIVIAGGGKLGVSLCQMLNSEAHDVALIEQDLEHLEDLTNRIDMLGVLGSASSYDTQLEAGVDDADVFVSVTPHDEINLIACQLAKNLGAGYTVARVHNPEYSLHMDFVHRSLGITQLLNPYQLAASEIARMIQFPTALSVESLADDRFHLVEVEVPIDSRLAGRNLMDFRREIADVLICAVVRDGEVFIPRGATQLEALDRLFVTGTRRSLRHVYHLLASGHDVIDSVMIIGGGRISFYLLKRIQGMKVRVKVIERDPDIAEMLAETFPQVTVVLGDGSSQDLLEEQRIANYDCVIALTGIDEENIIISLFGIDQGVPRNITKINRLRLLELIKEMRLQTVITPYSIMATEIVRGVRSLRGTRGSSLSSLHRIAGGEVEALEFRVRDDAQVNHVPLMNLKLHPGVLIATIVRGSDVLFPSGSDTIQGGDRVFVVTTNPGYDEVDDILLVNDNR